MYLSWLKLSDFRSYEAMELELGPGNWTFLGPNGQGKTNIVEAIQYLATLGSHRVATDLPLIRSGQDTATISARVQAGVGDDRSLSLNLEIRSGQVNRARLNRAPVRPRAILGAIRSIFFAPEDLDMVRGDPSGRRRFMDELAIARWPRIAGVKADYDRVLKQKTTLLKAMSGRSIRSAGQGAEETLEVWDDSLADLGSQLISARLTCLADLRDCVSARYDAIAPTPSRAQISYSSSVVPDAANPEPAELRQLLKEAISQRRAEEIARGVCAVGPHRDDLGLGLGDLPVKGYASHGESWSFALALRLASLDVLHDDGVDPLLILDDVFAELDEQRRQRLVAAMDSVEQSFVTAAVPADLPVNFQAQVYQVSRGEVHGPASVDSVRD